VEKVYVEKAYKGITGWRRGVEMNLYEMFAVRHKMLVVQHKWLVDMVAEMREMQRAPSVLVRSAKRKAAERAVDRYLETYKNKEDINGGKL
jgi:hypothetical protein